MKTSPSLVLVTGGAGFIGSHLVRRLLSDGYRVRVLDNFATGQTVNLEGLPDLDIAEGDVRSTADAARAVRGVDAIFHLAALASVAGSWEDPVSNLATNAHGTAIMVEAAEAADVGAFIYSSSCAIYGDQNAPLISESLEPKPISPYGYAKLLGEKIALAHGKHLGGIRVLALRYFNVFGSRQDPNNPYSAVIPIFIKHAISGTIATIDGDGTQTRDFTHVDNVVNANLCALRSDASGRAMNIACGESQSLLGLVRAISEINQRQLRLEFGPRREGDIHHSLADISLAGSQIGYRPKVRFLDGLRRTFDEYRVA